jgi:hypothetical protein
MADDTPAALADAEAADTVTPTVAAGNTGPITSPTTSTTTSTTIATTVNEGVLCLGLTFSAVPVKIGRSLQRPAELVPRTPPATTTAVAVATTMPSQLYLATMLPPASAPHHPMGHWLMHQASVGSVTFLTKTPQQGSLVGLAHQSSTPSMSMCILPLSSRLIP